MTTVSVDLAYKNYRDIGIAVLFGAPSAPEVSFVQARLAGEPRPEVVAEYLASLCEDLGARRLFIDGPQAWKSPSNGLTHSRVCERELNTPAKTGLPGIVKPANYLGFVSFSIEVFEALARLGWSRLDGEDRAEARTMFESFPLAAWRCLGLTALPAKRRTLPDVLRDRTEQLGVACGIEIPPVSSHDELQALVAGLAGPAIESGNPARLRIAGLAPFELKGTPREGFIVCPSRPPEPAPARPG